MNILTVILSVVFLLILCILPTMMYRRAAFQIIEIFRKHQAVGKDRARPLNELGLRPPGSHQRLFRKRDYKPRALQALIQAGMILPAEDDKYYLVEKKIENKTVSA